MEQQKQIIDCMNATYNPNIFSIMDYYISSGRFLNDKDRNINSDLMEIHDFFKPIDKIFGDYETRKKFGLDKELYRKNLDSKGNEAIISLTELNENRGKLIAFTVISYDYELRVKIQWIQPKQNSIKEQLEKVKEGIELANEVNCPVFEFYILDPVKLYQMQELDGARNIAFKKALLDTLGIIFNENNLEVYLEVIEEFVKCNLEGEGDSLDKIYATFLENANEDEVKSNIDTIYDAFKQNKVKIKNFERFKDVKIRLGRYDDGRYVIFMHPYNSESNCPGRIPSE